MVRLTDATQQPAHAKVVLGIGELANERAFLA